MRASRLPLVVLATAGVALAATVVAANLSHREKRIGRRIKRLYSAADPDLARAMGVFARRDPASAEEHHLRELHLLVWDRRQQVRRGSRRTLARRGEGAADADATPLMVVAMVLVQKLYIERCCRSIANRSKASCVERDSRHVVPARAGSGGAGRGVVT
jgi:hypothetical protein